MPVHNPKPWPFKNRVLTVSPDGFADYTTIQAAIDAAGLNDTILVGNGDYPEVITVNKQLTIVAVGSSAAINSANLSPLTARINPVLAAGQAAVTFTVAGTMIMRGFWILPTAPSVAGAASAVRVVNAAELYDCRVELKPTGATVGPFYGVEYTSVTGQGSLHRCSINVAAPSSGTRRALFVAGTNARLRVYSSRFVGFPGFPGAADIEINNASSHLYLYDCECEDAVIDTASADLYIDVTTRVRGTRITPGDPTIEGATPDGVVWYDTATSKLRLREGGISKDVISASGGVFGSEYGYVESEARSTSTTTVFTRKVRLTTGSLPAGTYRIGWHFTWDYSDAAQDFIGRVEVDDTTTLLNMQQEPKDPGADQRHPVAGFKEVVLGAGVHDIDLDWSAGSSGDTAGISQARLEIWRVA